MCSPSQRNGGSSVGRSTRPILRGPHGGQPGRELLRGARRLAGQRGELRRLQRVADRRALEAGRDEVVARDRQAPVADVGEPAPRRLAPGPSAPATATASGGASRSAQPQLGVGAPASSAVGQPQRPRRPSRRSPREAASNSSRSSAALQRRAACHAARRRAPARSARASGGHSSSARSIKPGVGAEGRVHDRAAEPVALERQQRRGLRLAQQQPQLGAQPGARDGLHAWRAAASASVSGSGSNPSRAA